MRLPTLVLLALLTSVTASAQSRQTLANMDADIANAEQEIEDLKLFAEMKDADTFIPKRSRCSTYIELAKGYRDELKSLNQRYAGRYDDAYRQRAKTLVEYNKDALGQYKACFGSVAAQRYLRIRAAEVYRFDPFVARFNQLQDWFGRDTNLSARLGELQRELHDLKRQRERAATQGDFAGTITTVFRDVSIERNGKVFTPRKNDKVHEGDFVITGNYARTRIEMNDRDEARDSGPTVLNVGSGSRVRIEQFHARPASGGLVDLIRGGIRAMTYGFGGRAAFSVRTGTSLCGIRGTEVMIERDERTGITRHWLLHGDADLTVGSVTRKLVPMHVVETSSAGRMTERPFRQAEYDALGNPSAELRPAVATRWTNGTDLPGSDYRSFFQQSADPRICASACEGDNSCRAWTWVRPGVQGQNAKCWLKSRVPAARKSDCCVSGVK